jgi:cephalosporin hydroxylase
MTGALAATNLHAFATEWVDCAPHYPTLIALARDAKTVVEFGVRGGVSTWALLDGLPDDGHLWSVDIIDCVVPPRVSEDPRWTFLVGDDLDPAVQNRLPDDADLIFIDTSHTYEQTKAELDYALTFAPDKIALHDYELPEVSQAVDEFCVAQGWHVAARERSQWGFVVLAP